MEECKDVTLVSPLEKTKKKSQSNAGSAGVYLVDPAQRGHVHSLSPDCTGTTDTSGVLTRSTVDDGVHQNLKRVLQEKGGDKLKTGVAKLFGYQVEVTKTMWR